jgi:hypothetical protein
MAATKHELTLRCCSETGRAEWREDIALKDLKMPERRTMSYKQLFLLILTIWSAELFTRLLFDAMIPPQMEYRTVYMEKDAKKGLFLGSSLGDFGRRGWKIVSVIPDHDNSQQIIVFMQRQTILRINK